MKKKLLVLAVGYLIGSTVAGIEVAIAEMSLARKKGYDDEEKIKSLYDLMKALHYKSLFKEIKTFVKENH